MWVNIFVFFFNFGYNLLGLIACDLGPTSLGLALESHATPSPQCICICVSDPPIISFISPSLTPSLYSFFSFFLFSFYKKRKIKYLVLFRFLLIIMPFGQVGIWGLQRERSQSGLSCGEELELVANWDMFKILILILTGAEIVEWKGHKTRPQELVQVHIILCL